MDIEEIKVKFNFRKLYTINGNSEEIYFLFLDYLYKAKLDKSNKIKESNKLYSFNVLDFAPISEDKIYILVNNYSNCDKINDLKEKKPKDSKILILSLKNENFCEYLFHFQNYINNITFFKEKNEFILRNNNTLHFYQYIKSNHKYQYFLSLHFNSVFNFIILNKKTFIICTNDYLSLYDTNTLNIKKKNKF